MLRLASAAGMAGLCGGVSTGAGALKRCGGASGSRLTGTGAKLRATSGDPAADFSGACSTRGEGAMNRCGAKSGSRSRDRFDSERNSGVRSRSRSHRGGTMGRAGSISNGWSLAGGAAEDLGSGWVAGARPQGGSAGIGAVNREDWVASRSLSRGVAAESAADLGREGLTGEEGWKGSGDWMTAGGATLSTGAGRSANRP